MYRTINFNYQFLRYCYNIKILCVFIKQGSMLKYKITTQNTIMIKHIYSRQL